LPFFKAAIEMAAWVWSGVMTFTAVRSFSFSSSSRKSTYVAHPFDGAVPRSFA
jgi:hypothetical protein